MVKRRHIGPAFERSPLERLTDWFYRNMLFVIAAILAIVIYIPAINWVFDSLFPMLEGGGDAGQKVTISSNHPVAITVKAVGSLAILIIFYTRSNKR